MSPPGAEAMRDAGVASGPAGGERYAPRVPLVSIIVPVLDAARYLPLTLPPLVKAVASDPAAELIIVDNGSTDESPQITARLAHGSARCLQAAGTIAAVRNAGAAAAGGSILVFVDADCLICEGYLDALRASIPDALAGATGSPYDLPPNPHWVERIWHALHVRTRDGRRRYLNGGNLVVPREVFQQVGGFREELVTGEDADFAERLWAAGLSVRQSSGVRVQHLGNPKSMSSFFRKQVWHGLGPLQLDRPTVSAMLYGVTVGGGLALLVRGAVDRRPGFVLAAIVAINLVPIASVFVRALQGGWRGVGLRGVALYHLYFVARLRALWLLLMGRVQGHRH